MFGYTNNEDYELVSERQLSEILAKFSSEYIYDIISDQIEKRYGFPVNGKPNMVNVFKSNFDNIRTQFPVDVENTNIVEQQTYRNIINIICDRCGVSLTGDIDSDTNLYIPAAALYSLLVSDFNTRMLNFTIQIIRQDKTDIFTALNMEELKKNKDSATIYNSLKNEDEVMGLIIANILGVLKHISNLDISLGDIVQSQYAHPESDMIMSFVSENEPIYNNFIKTVLSSDEMLPEYITRLRLSLAGV